MNIEKSTSSLSDKDLATLAQAGVIPVGTPAPILSVFAVTCQQHGLSPFKKEIYLVCYGGKYSTIVGIDGLRAKADRTGQLAGKDDAKFDLMPDGAFKTSAQLKQANAKPTTCTVTVYRAISGMRCPFTKTVLFSEYCPANASNKWASMPFNMIEKCAEAAALRMGFASETAGLHIEEESAAMQDITIQAAANNPSAAIDPQGLEVRLSAIETVEVLAEIYKEHPGHAQFAQLFTERKEEILDALQIAGKL
jgi:phage recombination protein Bet